MTFKIYTATKGKAEKPLGFSAFLGRKMEENEVLIRIDCNRNFFGGISYETLINDPTYGAYHSRFDAVLEQRIC